MANPRYPTSGCIGANSAAPIPVAFESASGNGEMGANQFQPGLAMYGDGNTQWAVGRASGAVSTGSCTFNPTTFLITDAAGSYTADTALADGELGWVRLTAGANP